eukprot:m51a1_g6715 putative Homocysteine S-methyltransferase (307) ;mRNA; r:135547-136467
MTKLDDLLSAHGGVVLGDGAMGTMLQAAGLEPGACPELWNTQRASDVRSVHDAYLRAGALVIETNTFGANARRLGMHSIPHRAGEFAQRGARIAREAADAHRAATGAVALVAGSMGPTGELMEPLGGLTAALALSCFEEQARALASGGADLLLLETFSALDELRAALEGARAGAPELPLIATMSFAKRQRTAMGVRPAQLVALGREFGVAAVGFNCGLGPEEARAVAALFAEASAAGQRVALVGQANAGLPVLQADGSTKYGETPESMAAYARAMKDAGLAYIGSCCGSTPEHTRAMAQALGLPVY